MNFRRISENTIRCVLTEEDMREYDLKIEDFLKNKEKVHNVLEYIVERAKEEVDYKMDGAMLAMQVMPLPKNGVAITFSENVEDNLGNMMEHIKDMVGELEMGMKENLSMLEDIDSEEKPISFEEYIKNVMTAADKEKKNREKKKGKKKSVQNTMHIFRFSKLEHVENYAMQIPIGKTIKSQLFKDEQKKEYYLVMEKGRLSVKDFGYFCGLAEEFGTVVSDDSRKLSYMEEHFTKLIKKSAINTIKKIAAI